jgi:hypothetical protein
LLFLLLALLPFARAPASFREWLFVFLALAVVLVALVMVAIFANVLRGRGFGGQT